MKKNSLIETKGIFCKAKEQKKYVGKINVLWMFSILFFVILTSIGMAEERYRGTLIVDKYNGEYEIDNNDFVELVIDKDIVKSIKVSTKAANKDLTFSGCRTLKDDGSDFTKWFSIECRTMKSYDGTPFMFEPFFAGAYVGISPQITPQYSMYKTLKGVTDSIGLDVPSRTFIIYANKKPVYEFFCYPEQIKMTK